MGSSMMPFAAGGSPACSSQGVGLWNAVGSGCGGMLPMSSPLPLSSEAAAPSEEEAEKLQLGLKKGDNILKIGLAQVELARSANASIIKENLHTLTSKLKELDGKLADARRVQQFRSMEGAWGEDFEGQLSLLADATLQAELQGKVLKTLLASMKTSTPSTTPTV